MEFKDRAFSDAEIDEVLEKHGIKEKLETEPVNPSHYCDQDFDTANLMESLFLQLAQNAFKECFTEEQKATLKQALWVAFAQKHLIRLGKKDGVSIELQKAENYLHKSRTGDWIK